MDDAFAFNVEQNSSLRNPPSVRLIIIGIEHSASAMFMWCDWCGRQETIKLESLHLHCLWIYLSITSLHTYVLIYKFLPIFLHFIHMFNLQIFAYILTFHTHSINYIIVFIDWIYFLFKFNSRLLRKRTH